MTPRSLFMIILKCLGILFVKDILVTLPILLSTFASFLAISQRDQATESILTIFILIFSIGIYFLVAYYLIFKSAWIVEKLKLDKDFEEETFSIRIHRSSILSIVLVITGLLIVIDAIPVLFRQLISYFQVTDLFDRTGVRNIIIPSVQIIIGLLLIGNQRQIVNFIERKRRKIATHEGQI